MQWYYKVLARRPYFMILAITVLCCTCIIVSFTARRLPDFSDPTLGFETRGTDIGKRLVAWRNLLQETGPSSFLVANPKDLNFGQELYKTEMDEYRMLKKHRKNRKNRKRKNKQKQKKRKTSNPELIKIPNNSKEITRKKMKWQNESHLKKSLIEEEHLNKNLQFSENDNAAAELIIFSGFSSNLTNEEDFSYGRNMTFVDEDDHRVRMQTKKNTWRLLQQATFPTSLSWNDDIRVSIEGYFCDSPDKAYSHFVAKRIGPNATDSLFDLNGLLAMCQLQDQITQVNNYDEYCQRELISNNCCRPWSLPNYVAFLANKSSCFDITNTDVLLLQNLLLNCFEYYRDLKLSNDCNEVNRCYAPVECTRNNVVFNILHYLADQNFIRINDSDMHLKYAMIFVPIAHSTKILPLFHGWEKIDLSNELVQVIAMDLGLENELFNELLVTDAWLVALGGIFVMACMWLYTGSIFVTIMTCVAVIFSLGLAYFIYTMVFEMSFFPYMNLLAVVVIIGIGADDAFIFVKIWQCVLKERFSKTSTFTNVNMESAETLENLIALTLRHASVSMFVTSVTTAGAFFASYTSYITAIKCFGVFAGTAVITNYILMVTWLPASVSLMERLTYCGDTCNKLQIHKLMLMFNKSINRSCQNLENCIIEAVINYAFLWSITFGAIGILSIMVVLYKPGLKLPESSHFQLFVSNHPFEIYNSKLKYEFWFEKSISNYENFKLPLRFVWGIQPIDDGDYANPFIYGNLHYDNNFNISTKAAQLWLLEFCQNLKQQPFYQLTFGLFLPDCFIENLIALMDRMCVNSMDDIDRSPCCNISRFPYETEVFNFCLPQIISSLYATPRKYFVPGVAGPRFMAAASSNTILNINNSSIEDLSNSNSLTNSSVMLHTTSTSLPLVKVIVIEFESNFSYTTIYQDVKEFVNTIEMWFRNELQQAPPEMQGGWFISELKFYDVQDTLTHGTLIAITVAMGASLMVLLLVTCNVLVSLYAVVTVLFTIFVTVAILVLFDWKLNILESVTVSTAIGLAVDFSLHYGIHYRLSPTCERLAATQFALSRIIGPTAMAAVTTGVAGGIMLFSNVLPYLQIGIFLVVVMTVSWLYATLFLMSLLKLFGPQYGFMQFAYPRMVRKNSKSNGITFYERKTCNLTANEQLLTPCSSGMGDLVNSETHELESLTSNTLIKTISGIECSQQNLPMEYEQIFSSNSLRSTSNVTLSKKSKVFKKMKSLFSDNSNEIIESAIPNELIIRKK
uniref:SSD domain-containing protein n=1 Tax=Glossina brevipalpis TaxID=37001 RepID=A0A1A9WPG7_9MUSC